MKTVANYEKEADYEGHILLSRFGGGYGGLAKQLHFHDSIELLFVERGTCGLRVGAEEHVLCAGEIGFVDRFYPHVYRPSPDATGYVTVISAQYLSRCDLRTVAFPAHMPRDGEAFARLQLLLEKTADDWESANKLMKSGFVELLLGLLLRYYPAERQTRKDTEVPIAVLEYIDTHFAQPITLRLLSETFGYTPSYLSSMFNRFAGMNLREYVNRRRIGEAIRMQNAPEHLPIYKIAALCGFESLNTFYRAYARYADKNQKF